MPILLKSLQGVGHAINVSTKVSKKLNEDSSLDLTIIENASTFDAIGAITKMWTITHVEGEDDFNEYVIVILDKSTIGEKIRLDIKARQKNLMTLTILGFTKSITKVLQALSSSILSLKERVISMYYIQK